MIKNLNTSLVIRIILVALLGISLWELTPLITTEAMKNPLGREIILALKPLLKLGGW